MRVPVTALLGRVPVRAVHAYHALVTHPDTCVDQVSGWASSYLTQEVLAEYMGMSIRTLSRSIADLRGIGVCRVLTWPGAQTETSVRVADIAVPDSVFGPVRMRQAADTAAAVDSAISVLVREFDEILWDIELSYFDCSDQGTTKPK